MKLNEIARKAIECYLEKNRFEPDYETKSKYGKNGACFVNILKEGKLRGCVGTLNSFQPLYEDVISNAVNAGFRDYRFNPLNKQELNEISIEVFVLSKPRKINSKNLTLLKLSLKKDLGVILKKGPNSATFLPQMWKEFPNKKDFLERLSLKAGLKKDEWRDSDIYTYKIKVFKD